MENQKLVNQMPFREIFGIPVIISFGFCCSSVNAIIGSFYFPRHLEGNVAYFLTPS